MTKETAITKTIEYETKDCHVCGGDVALSQAHNDTIDDAGYAVLLGEGKIKNQISTNGNWDREFRFTFTKNDTQHPTVESYIICEDCAEMIHQYQTDGETYTGGLPEMLSPSQNSQSNFFNRLLPFFSIFLLAVFIIII